MTNIRRTRRAANPPTRLVSANAGGPADDSERLRKWSLVDSALEKIVKAQSQLSYGRRQEGEAAQDLLAQAVEQLNEAMDGEGLKGSEGADGKAAQDA